MFAIGSFFRIALIFTYKKTRDQLADHGRRNEKHGPVASISSHLLTPIHN
jgi:hypothetical protein